MKLVHTVLICVAVLFALPTTRAADPPREPKPRFKGVELYSWKDDKGAWQFALLDGTNEEKEVQKVKVGPHVLAGKEKLVAAMKLLAEGENVSWSHNINGFEYPPKDDLKKIDAAAKDAKVTLSRPER
jgi:hypothetical protein